jgi:lipopolysaccharide transport system permease protein
MWEGDYVYLFENLILKDFRIRYRNMSLGVFWSLLNPLIMMAVLTFIFTQVFPIQSIQQFPIFLLCGLVPFNFFAMAWASSATSVADNAGLIKRVPVPREVIPIASVLSHCVHLLIQVALLLGVVLLFGRGANRHWIWLPVIWGLEVIFVCGLGLMFAAFNVYVRDTRYVIESANTVLYWLVPIFYIPQPQWEKVYQFNPIAAIVYALRYILWSGVAPPMELIVKLACGALFVFAVGLYVFNRLKYRFYDYL